MRRRHAIVLLGGAAVVWPAVSRAQPGARLHRIGWLDYNSSAENIGIFGTAMGQRGWREGETFRIEHRGGLGRPERLTSGAAELVRLPVDVIIAPGSPEALIAHKATDSIPIVITGIDEPMMLGLVGNLARPAGNITGVASPRSQLAGKLLSLLREIVPQATIVAALWDTNDPDHQAAIADLHAAARALGISLTVRQVQRPPEVEAAVATFAEQGHRMLIAPFSTLLVPRWIADLASHHRLALGSTSPGFAYEGGLMAYTEDWDAMFDRTAAFVDRILKGARPDELPVELPTKFKLIVNAATARGLGLSIPESITVRADHVIE